MAKTAAKPVPGMPQPGSSRFDKYLPWMLIPLFGIFYYRLLFGMNFLWEDIPEIYYPLVLYAVDSLKHFQFPFWTPYIFGGMPFFSDPQTTLFYPPFWLLFLASLVTKTSIITFTWYILLHILFMGFGTYFLSRDFGMQRISALFSAVAFMFCGFVSLHVMHTFIYVVAWFPLAFLFLRRAYATGSIRDLLIAALLHGCSILGGYPQYSMHLVYFFFLWTIFEAVVNRKSGKRFLARLGVFFGLFAGIGLALAAVQYLPSFELMAQSSREKMTLEQSVNGSLSWQQIICFAAPKFFGWITGDPSTGSPFWAFPEKSYLFWETAFFIGVTPLLLALRSIIDIRKNAVVIFFVLIAGVCFLLAMGDNTPLYGIVFNIIPGFKTFRIPGRFLFGMSFSLVMLAGLGLNRILAHDAAGEKTYRKVILGVGGAIGALALLFLAGAFNSASQYFEHAVVIDNAKHAATVALIVTCIASGLIIVSLRAKSRMPAVVCMTILTFCELFAFGNRFGCGNSNPEKYYARFDLSPFQQEYRQSKFRIQGRLFQGEGKGEMLLPRNLGNVKHIPLVEGYNQLNLQRYGRLIFEVNENAGQKLFNVRYRKVPHKNQIERLDAVPRFYCSPFYIVRNDRQQVIDALNAPGFTPGRDIVLESEPGIPLDTINGTGGDIRIIKDESNRIELDISTRGNTLLSASEIYFSAWNAYIDGKKAPLLPANLAFRAIPLTAGTHRVVMAYESSAFVKGGIISLLALLVVLAGLVVAWKIPRFSAFR
jgi:hypothetical protein